MARRLLSILGALAWLALLIYPAPGVSKDTAKPEPARLVVQLPADAQLSIDTFKTTQTGEVRTFLTPSLEQGKTFQYTLKATWTEQGRTVVRERDVKVMAGRETTVDLRRADEAKMTGPGKMVARKSDEMMTSPAETAAALPNREPDLIFVPTPQAVVDKMLELAEVGKGDTVYDLGCGDGRILVTAAKHYGAKAVGVEIDPVRVKEAKDNAEKSKVAGLVQVVKGDLFTQDLSGATVVTLYLTPKLNLRLLPNLEKLKPGSRIVSHDFDMQRLVKPSAVVRLKARDDAGEVREHTIYLWKVPLQKQ